MTHIQNFAEARELLATFIPQASQPGSYSLDSMQALMTKLDNPQDSYKVVHIAGTSGKTSTSYYMAALLQQADQKVGLTISPHVDEVNERVQIGLVPLPEAEFCQKLGEFIDIVKATNVKPTYFELLIAFAYWYFDKEKVDYAVVEVGLGGLMDCTNVIHRPDKICAVTDIGMDHMNVLGNTLEQVATQKAGIIQPHNPVFMYNQGDEAMAPVRERCAQEHAQLYEVVLPSEQIKELPPFQQRNYHLAKEVFDFIVTRDGIDSLSQAKQTAASHTKIPARLEVVRLQDKTIIIDGSHNEQKMAAAMEGIRMLYPGQKVSALVSFVESKYERANGALEELLPVVDSLIVTSYSSSQDSPKYSVDPNQIANTAKRLGFEDVSVINEPEKALQELLNQPNQVLLVTGSFYLLNHIRPLIFKRR